MRKTSVSAPVLAVALLLAFNTPSVAQQSSIAGTVTSAVDAAGITAAQVQVLRSDGSVVATELTGADGAYRVADISPGTYSVSFSATGWESRTETGVVVTAGNTTTVSPVLLQRAFTLNPLSVTASKKVEKALDAPASVQVVTTEDIRDRPATSLTDHIKGKAAVDVVKTGIQSNYVVVRGFNNIFSGSTLNLTDYRIARVPSLRANISHLQPTTNLDIDRVEVVLGPASALYGPNAANGVVHYLTRSPIDAPGAGLSIAWGSRQQDGAARTVPVIDLNGNGLPDDSVRLSFDSSTEDVVHIEGRYAVKTADDRFGVKLSGQYFTGGDYRFIDESEVQQRAIAGACIAAGFDPSNAACLNFAGDVNPTTPEGASAIRTRAENVAAGRDPDLERWALDLRADFRPTDEMSVIVSGGRTTAVNSIDLTGIGAAQVQDWGMWYGQARANYKRLFGQVFFNKSINDETYLLRSGRPLIDKSSLVAAQLQHGSDISPGHSLIYGLDFLHTVPQTEGTINGSYEGDDEIDEIGGYAQYDAALSELFNLTLAARLDKHSRLDDPVFSPRAALVYQPDQENSFRLTFNRAFTTPTTLNFFLDISAQSLPIFGPFRYDIRTQGTGETGLDFRRQNGIPMHMSPFNPLLGGPPREFLATTTAQLWNEAREVIRAGSPQAGGLLDAISAPTGAQVPVVAALLDPESGGFGAPILDLTSINDSDALTETTWQTLEAGYKGLAAGRWLVAVNGYWTKVNDFVSALQPISPNVFLPEDPTRAYLQEEFRGLVGGPFPDTATADATAAQIAEQIGQIPLGVITPGNAGGTTDAPIVFTYRNLGDFDLFGADIALSYLLSDHVELTGTVSWVSDEEFDTGTEIVPLNAPSWKGSLGARYRDDDRGVTSALRARFIDGFPVASGVYRGDVEGYAVFDVNFGVEIPGTEGLRAQFDVQNVFDDSYQTFPGTPSLGRFTVLRLLWTP